MSREYEFAYQSTKQKLILLGLKLLIILMLAHALYGLGWYMDEDTPAKLRKVGTVLFCFWVYINLLRVKIEVQELFVPPMDITHGKEFLLVGFAFGLGDTFYTIYQIYLLS